MNSSMTISLNPPLMTYTSIGVPGGKRPGFVDVVLALRVAHDVPALAPQSLTLSFSVLSGSGGASSLQRRLRELADAMEGKPLPDGDGATIFVLELGDLVQAPPESESAA